MHNVLKKYSDYRRLMEVRREFFLYLMIKENRCTDVTEAVSWLNPGTEACLKDIIRDIQISGHGLEQESLAQEADTLSSSPFRARIQSILSRGLTCRLVHCNLIWSHLSMRASKGALFRANLKVDANLIEQVRHSFNDHDCSKTASQAWQATPQGRCRCTNTTSGKVGIYLATNSILELWPWYHFLYLKLGEWTKTIHQTKKMIKKFRFRDLNLFFLWI